MQKYHKEPILGMLKDKFDAEDNNLSDAFYNIARNMSKEYYDNHKGDLRYLIENSFLVDMMRGISEGLLKMLLPLVQYTVCNTNRIEK